MGYGIISQVIRKLRVQKVIENVPVETISGDYLKPKVASDLLATLGLI